MNDSLVIAVNPGTTTTRCAAYRPAPSAEAAPALAAERTFEHSDEQLGRYAAIAEQLAFRLELLESFAAKTLRAASGAKLVACAGRGGMLTPVPPGVIRVNEALVEFSLHTPVYQHSSNLGAPLAHALAERHGCPAFIADPVSVDELTDVSRISGSPEFPRFSFVHALNIRATARKTAAALGRRLDELNLVIAHLGAGFSIAAMRCGRLIDNSNRMECSPFTPERCGGLPPIPLIEASFSGRYTRDELMKRLYGEGGVYAYLGTRDMRRVEAMIDAGDARAALIFEAMRYQIKKAIGAMAGALDFELDGIALTGGLVNSRRLTEDLSEACARIGPVFTHPGSNETEALAAAAFSALVDSADVMEWPVAAPAGAAGAAP